MGNEILICLEKVSGAFEWKTGDFITMVPKARKEISNALTLTFSYITPFVILFHHKYGISVVEKLKVVTVLSFSILNNVL